METNSKEEDVTPQPAGGQIEENAGEPAAEALAVEEPIAAEEHGIHEPHEADGADEIPLAEVPVGEQLVAEPLAEAMVGEPLPESAAETETPVEEAAPQPEAGAGEHADPLGDLAARSQAARLSAAEEEQMGRLLKEALLSGRTGISKAIEYLPLLPWIVGVRAVESTWPEMKITARAQLLKGLADIESDSARRIRLSLARALFKLDPATSLKLTAGVCKEFKDKENGALSQKHAQIFANVFVGKVKPWLSQISLAGVKPADADLLVHCALMAVFSLSHPPITQLGVLKWAGEAERLGKLAEPVIAAITKSVSRWSPRWQNTLFKEVPSLPQEIIQVLKHVNPGQETTAEAPSKEQPAPAADVGADTGDDVAPSSGEVVSSEQDVEKPAVETEPGAVEEPPRKARPVYEPRPQKQPVGGETDAPRDRGDRGDRGGREMEQREQKEREHRKERPVYQSRTAGNAGFNLPETLRQIEAHVQSLRSELNAAQSKLADREEETRRSGGSSRRGASEQRPTTVIIPGEPTVEELARLNLQLEARNTELQQRIDDLGIDSEDRAASMGAHSEEQVTDVNQQLRTLLGLKLQDDYADFAALEDESTSVVVQQHYRSLLSHIFEVLKHEGVEFKG